MPPVAGPLRGHLRPRAADPAICRDLRFNRHPQTTQGVGRLRVLQSPALERRVGSCDAAVAGSPASRRAINPASRTSPPVAGRTNAKSWTVKRRHGNESQVTRRRREQSPAGCKVLCKRKKQLEPAWLRILFIHYIIITCCAITYTAHGKSSFIFWVPRCNAVVAGTCSDAILDVSLEFIIHIILEISLDIVSDLVVDFILDISSDVIRNSCWRLFWTLAE